MGYETTNLKTSCHNKYSFIVDKYFDHRDEYCSEATRFFTLSCDRKY